MADEAGVASTLPIAAAEIRNQLVTRAAAEGWLCYFTHDLGEQPIQFEATDKGYLVRRQAA